MKLTGRKTVKGDKVSAPLSAKAPSVKTQAARGEPSHDDIARRAYELYLERGSLEGHHDEDWLIAEAELRRPS